MTRAFRPMPIILNLINDNFKKYKNLIMFMGNSGQKILSETLKVWNLEFERRKSLTSDESFLLNIKKAKRKFL